MSQDALLVLGALAVIALLQLVLLLRRPAPDAGLLATLTELRAAGERGAIAAEAARVENRAALDGLGRDLSGFAVEQGRLLTDAAREQRAAIEAGGREVAAALARESAADRTAAETARREATEAAAALRTGLADSVGALTIALGTAQRDAEGRLRDLLEAGARGAADAGAATRRDLNAGLAELKTTLTDGARAGTAAATAEATRVRDLLDRRAEESRTLIDTKLREMREANDARLDAMQRTVNEQLAGAVEKQMSESFQRVVDQIAAVQKMMVDVQAVTTSVGDIKRLFSNVKTRGGLGEVQLRALLDDMLAGGYEAQCRVCDQSGNCVDFAVTMPMQGRERVLLPIDAKFPTEDYDRLVLASEAGEVEAERLARRGLEARIRSEAAKIAQKYIRPPLTVEFAVLYLPTDGLYAEVARLPGLIDELHRKHRVLVLGPSLLPAMLRTIQLGHLTLQLSQNAKGVQDLLGAAKVQVKQLEEVMGKLAKQADTFSRTAHDAEKRARIMGGKLRGVTEIEPARATALLALAPELEDVAD